MMDEEVPNELGSQKQPLSRSDCGRTDVGRGILKKLEECGSSPNDGRGDALQWGGC